jgi:acetyl-CoA carboxylase biotin carboxyl carrier protein
MSADGQEPGEEPGEEPRMTDTVDEAGLVDPVAVGPGDPLAARRPVDAAAPGDAAPVDAVRAPGLAAPVPGSGPGPVPGSGPVAGADREDTALLALVDRLTGLLERNDLGELEVGSGGTTIILRSPSVIERPAATAATAAPAIETPAAPGAGPTPVSATPAATPSVKAPLTGLFYGAPSPGATAYVSVGDHVSVGQLIGLIEAMKLFNEIKSDLAGRVVRICADNGALVKAKQPLIEVEPA